MPSKNDWVMRPVIRGCCRYESLLTGDLSLNDIAEMHDALDVDIENQSRYHDALQKKNAGR
jgi:hypothetical protein